MERVLVHRALDHAHHRLERGHIGAVAVERFVAERRHLARRPIRSAARESPAAESRTHSTGPRADGESRRGCVGVCRGIAVSKAW